MAGAAPGSPTFQVTPASQVIGRGVAAVFTISLLPSGTAASLRYVFALTDDGAGGAMLYADGQSPEIEHGASFTTFHAANNTNGTYVLTITPPASLGGSAVNVTLIVGRDWTVTPSSQTAQSGTPTGNYTIALANSDVAPSGGFAFGLATSAASGGSFSTGASATILAGANSVTFAYTGTLAETDTLAITPPDASSGLPQAVKTVQAVITAAAPPPPPPVTFALSPASQSATTGSASGLITLTLSSAAPAGGLTFGLSTDETSGGSFSTGSSVTVAAGQTSATFTYTSTADVTCHLTVSPPGSGVSGGAQNVAVTFSTPVVVTPPPVVTPPAAPVSSSGVEVDIRCYNAAGARRAMPPVDEISFEIAEQGGGMQTGSLQMLATWEETGWKGTEYIDVYLWGSLVYRGYVRQPQQEIGSPERSSPTLHGLMTLLNGYKVRRDFGYTPAVSPSQLFRDIASLYVTRPGRMPDLILDTTGVDNLYLTLWGMQAKDKTVPQALNSLCELFPNQLIWGCDVDAYGRNRLYLRPRAIDVKYVFSVGGNVSGFVYPRDYSQIVNRLYITGAKFDGSQGTNPGYVNLLPNASFETGAPNNEIDGNLLTNGGFEDTGAFNTASNPWQTGGAFIRTSPTHSGSQSCELNNDDIGQEYVAQDIAIAGPPSGVHAACWWCAAQGLTWTPNIRLELFAGSTLVASTNLTPQAIGPEVDSYNWYHFQLDWRPPQDVTCNRLRVSYILSAESSTGDPAGQTLVDDCSVWIDGPELAKSWRVTNGHNGAWASVDWRNRDITPYDGDVLLKGGAVITGGAGSYAELATSVADRPQASINSAYHIQFKVYNAGNAAIYAAIGARIFSQGTQQGADSVGAQIACPPGQWTDVSGNIRTPGTCDALEAFFRAYTSGTYYIDAAGLWIGRGTAPPTYVESDTYQTVRSVTSYAPAVLGNEAAYSIANYGEIEDSVSNDQIVDDTTADAYAVSYFKAKAVPQVQARLSLKQATAPVGLDGQIRVVNLANAPDALTPARIHYQIGASVDIDVDLDNELPQLENLLRLVAAGKA